MRPGTRRLLFAIVLAVWGWALWEGRVSKPPGPSAWRPPTPVAVPQGERPLFEREFIDRGEASSVHVATACELPDGTLCASWYGGTAERTPDVGIYFAKLDTSPAGHWSPPRVLLTRESAASELHRYVKAVGNSLVFTDPDGRLWLVYVTIALGGWSGSSLNVKTSEDGGASWTLSERLTLSPFLNLSDLVRNKPASVARDGIGIPIYQEFLGRFPELLWLSRREDGRLLWSKQRIASGDAFIQPSIVWTGGTHLRAFLRDCTNVHRIAVSDSADGGRSWSSPARTSLPNPNSALDTLRLADGRLLIVFNDTTVGRENLRLAISEDDGRSWRRVATLEDEARAEFSYPCILQDRAGRIHIVYTWKREHIRHVVFNLAWLDEQAAAVAR